MAKALLPTWLCLIALLPFGAAAQSSDFLDRQQLLADVAGLGLPDAQMDSAGVVMTDLGLTWAAPVVPDLPAPPFRTDDRAVIEVVDIRLLLTQIAIQTGAQDHVALLRAQGDRSHDVILLRGGFASLSDLVALSDDTPAQDFILDTPAGVQLTLPLAIWSDAGLTLQADDHLILDRPSGSFVANLGWLNVAGGSISGNNAANSAEPAFRPFVMTAGQGGFTARSATFQALGFGTAAAFGGVAIANNGLEASRFASVVIDSDFEDVQSLGLIGTADSVLTGNLFNRSTGTAVLISNAQGVLFQANRLTALAGDQGVRVTARSTGIKIRDNLVTAAARTGILVDQDSSDVELSGNLVAGSLTAGIGLDRANCVTAFGNLVVVSGGSGISLKNSQATTIRENAILFNAGAGVLVRDQAATAQVRLSGNILTGNRIGVRGATMGALTLDNNNLDGQLPRLFAGDLAVLTVDWLRNHQSSEPTLTSAAADLPCTDKGLN